MLRLIVNADDLGLTPGCNAGIVKGLIDGIVSDTTLMVGSLYAEDAVRQLKKNGITQAGLHLNVTYGVPVLPLETVPSLTDESGRFRRDVRQAVAALDSKDAEKEFRAQVDKFLTTGLILTHLDSHHHAHTYPQLIDIALRLAKELNVPLRQNEEVKEKIDAAGVKTTDYFTTSFYGEGATKENLQSLIRSHKDGILEVMSHPAEREEQIFKISSYNDTRSKELSILTAPEMKDFLQDSGVKLISFAEL